MTGASCWRRSALVGALLPRTHTYGSPAHVALAEGVETEVLAAVYPGGGGKLVISMGVGVSNTGAEPSLVTARLYADAALLNSMPFEVGAGRAIQASASLSPAPAASGDRSIRVTLSPAGGVLTAVAIAATVVEIRAV